MISLNDNISQIKPSPTFAATTLAAKLRAEGKDIITLTVGEPDFDTPDHIKQAASAAMAEGRTKYTQTPGIPELREVISQKIKRDQGVDLSAEQIIVTNGGKQALATAFAVLLNPGDEVIIPSPYWTSYPDMVRLAGGNPVFVETKPENGYLMTPDEFRAAVTSKTRGLVLNTPSNPTGGCYSGEELKALGEEIAGLPNGSDICILSDEVYEYITYDGFEHVSFTEANPGLADQTLLINAFSKAYAMTGWRVGYAGGPQHIIKAMSKHQSQFTSNVCSIAQSAAAAAYADNYAFPKMMAKEFANRLEIVCQAVDETPGLSLSVKPRGAFFAFIRIEDLLGKSAAGHTINGGVDFANYLLESAEISIVAGEAFGDPAAIRMSFALATDRLQEALARMKTAVQELS